MDTDFVWNESHEPEAPSVIDVPDGEEHDKRFIAHPMSDTGGSARQASATLSPPPRTCKLSHP